MKLLSSSIRRLYRIDRSQIHFIKFILEGYDGIGVVRTLDADTGLIEVLVAPGCLADAEGILRHLGREIALKPEDDVT